MGSYLFGLLTSFVITILATPYVKRLANRVGAVDAPNHRKVHTRIMPRMGGLAIYAGYLVSFFLFVPLTKEMLGIFIAGTLVMFVGMLDDKVQLSARWKLIGQLIGAAMLAIPFGLKIGEVNLPFGGSIDFSEGWLAWLAVPLTIFWIVGVTNAINLIDGLDGLSAGVSAIATATMTVMALIMDQRVMGVAEYGFVLLGAILGFLMFNFHPAKIFMGDTGSLFLGFNLAALSVMGFKEALFVSFIIPIVVLGVPLWDTFFAIVRRIVNKKPISSPDKGHLHHCLLNMGLSHRATVMTIYGISLLFGLTAILLTKAALWASITIIAVLLIVIHLATEVIGLVGRKHRPLINAIRRIKLKNAERRSH